MLVFGVRTRAIDPLCCLGGFFGLFVFIAGAEDFGLCGEPQLIQIDRNCNSGDAISYDVGDIFRFLISHPV